MNEEFDLEGYDPSLSNLTPQEILNHLNKLDEQLSGNPYEIMKAINTFNSPKLTGESSLNNELLDLVGSYDYLTRSEKNDLDEFFDVTSKDSKNVNLHEILDEILNQDEDINSIKFNEDIETLFEEENLNLEKLENFDLNYIMESEIPKRIRDSDKKKGSVKQRTVIPENIYGYNKLLYKDEAEELFQIIRNKLLIYWDVIVDFEDVIVSDVFLKYAFGDLCQWLTPKEILQRIDIVNIDDEQYLNLINNSLPNMYKYWINEKGILEQNIALDKLELYKTLQPEDTEIDITEFKPEELSDSSIPFEIISASFLGKKREKKLKYPVYFVEKITGEVLEKYKVDELVNNYISDIIDSKINFNEVKENCKLTRYSEKYKLQFGIEDFNLIYSFTQNLLLDKCYEYLESAKNDILSIKTEIENIKKQLPSEFVNKIVSFQSIYITTEVLKKLPDHIRFRLRRLEELEFALMDLEHKFFIKEDILKNVFEIVSFSMYKTGLDKVKLIAFHYLTKYLENYSLDFWENGLDSKKIRNKVTVIEMYRFELVSVLQEDDNLRKFVFTIKELIMKWVFKYTYSSSLARTYFEFMMLTPEILTEEILRYIALIAIKNKNPMTLRAIYSSYISLIHTSIYLTVNANVYDKKYGFFKALEKQQENSYQTVDMVQTDRRVWVNSLIRTFMLKNPALLNDDYYLLKRMDISPMLELNSLKLYATKPDNVNMHDWWYHYVKYFQYFDKEPTYKIKSKFIKSDKRNSQMQIISMIAHETLREPIYNRIKDYDCVEIILDGICEDISMRTINRGYMDKNLKLTVKSHADYIDYIYNLLNDIKENLEKETK